MNQNDASMAKGYTVPGELREGCYLTRYTPVVFQDGPIAGHYDGTLRVERTSGPVAFSGDLYVHLPPDGEDTGEWPFIEAYPAYYAGIPIFPISAYSYYLRGIKVEGPEADTGALRAHFELFRYQSHFTEVRFLNQGCHTAVLQRTPAPALYPSKPDYWAGPVVDCSGAVVGFLTAGWMTPYLRQISIEMDKVAGTDYPLNDAKNINWQTIFDTVGYQVRIAESEIDIPEPSGESWSDAELHATMLERRDPNSLDREWYYYFLCVRRLDITERGVMFDRAAVDSNNVPREGAAISAHWEIPDEPVWGTVRGMRFGSATPVYFRTAVHEIGHALSLIHNSGGYVMTPTDSIAFQARSTGKIFPENILWAFAPDDARRLRHFPDPFIRPGGEPFGKIFSAPALPVDEEYRDALRRSFTRARGFEFKVEPLLDTVPLGAPVRVHATLTNAAKQAVAGPPNLKLRSGKIRGRVFDPAGQVRTFSPLVICPDELQPVEYRPGQSAEESYALLRGGQGALFPQPGEYRIEVDVAWEVGDRCWGATASTKVAVTPPKDAAHLAAATGILQSPDAFLTFVLAGDYLAEGVAVLATALQNPVLRPHYAMAEIRRLGRAFRDRPADVPAAAALLDVHTVLGPSEVRRAAELLRPAPAETDAAKKQAVKILRAKAARMPVATKALGALFDK